MVERVVLWWRDWVPSRGERPRLRAPLILAVVALGLVMQVFDPTIAWRMLLLAVGGLLLVGYSWTRSLQRGLAFSRSRRYGWAQSLRRSKPSAIATSTRS